MKLKTYNIRVNVRKDSGEVREMELRIQAANEAELLRIVEKVNRIERKEVACV